MQTLSRQEFYRRCNQVLDCIPAYYAKRDEIFYRVGDLWESMLYTAPENVGYRFIELTRILCQELPTPTTTEWTQQISNIMGRILDPEPSTDWMIEWQRGYRGNKR